MITAAIIVNPNAGRQDARAIAEQAACVLESQGWQVSIFSTQYPQHATTLAEQVVPQVSHIVVIGGDGTIREVIIGLGAHRHTVVLGLVPLGNANVLARDLGISLTPKHAIIAIAQSTRQRQIDVGRVGEHIFLCMVGVGYDAKVVQGVARIRNHTFPLLYRVWADGLYLLSGCLALLRPSTTPLTLSINDEGSLSLSELDSVVVCNTRSYAKGLAMTPSAHLSDGQLNYQGRKWLFGFATLSALLYASLKQPAPSFIARYGTAKRIIIASSAPFVWQADGDIMGEAERLEITLEPEQITIMV